MFKIISRRKCDQMKATIESQKANEQHTEMFSSLVKYHILKSDSYPCDKCRIETRHCMKLHFADRTICIVPSVCVNHFHPSKPKRMKHLQ